MKRRPLLMLKLIVSKTLAQNILHGKQNIIVTDHDCDATGDLVTLINKDTQKPMCYASIDSCVCDVANDLFPRLKRKIVNFTQHDFNQATNHHKLAFILKLSQIQKV